MIKCRLKIISSNIINGIDTPKIMYVSQNDIPKIIINYNEENDVSETKDNNLMNNNESEKINYEHNNEHNSEHIDENIESNNINNNDNNDNNYEQMEQIEEYINKQISNYIQVENNDSQLNEIKNINSNELYTISNQHIYDDNCFSPNVNNRNTLSHFTKNETNYNSSNQSDVKKNQSNLKLKYIFRKRENRNYINRSFSNNKYSKERNNKKNSLIKNIFKAHPVNYNYTTLKVYHGNKSSNKVGNILNININKSFCINNNIKINNKNIFNNKLNRNSKNKSKEKTLNKSKEIKQKKLFNKKEPKKEEKDVLKKVKNLNLKFNKRTNKNILINSISWNVIENKDINIEQSIDYNMLIDELMKKECDLIKEKENIIQTYEEKLKPIREQHSKLINSNSDDLDKEDELKGELVILKNQYEILFSSLNNPKKIDSKKIIINNNDEEFNNKIKNIDNEMKELNDQLKDGEILFVTKPNNIINLTQQEEKNIILMLKGLFYSIHIRDTDEIVNLIWNKNKQIQTIYFLINELMKIFCLKNKEKNILINFFYSFCKKYSYMDINTFKKEFKEKIGNIPLFNRSAYISKLMNFHKTKILELIKLIQGKDTFNLRIINLDLMNKLLNNLELFSDLKKYSNDIYEFIIIIMKKDRSLNLPKENKNKNKEKNSLFDLFYESLIDYIKEHNSKVISNPFELIRKYMKEKDIKNALSVLEPLINDEYIIKINNKEYFDIIILNKFLRTLGIIKYNEILFVNLFEEELVDKYQFINNIYDYGINENKENKIKELNQHVNDFINEIFQNCN